MRKKRRSGRRSRGKQTISVLRAQLAGEIDIVREGYEHERVIVFVPSMSIPDVVLGDITGIEVYEERMLYIMAFLKRPKTHVVFVSSRPVEACVIDYYARTFATHEVSADSIKHRFHNMVAGVTGEYLTKRILRNARLCKEIRDVIEMFESKVLMCFAVSYAEEQLARALSVPLFGSRAALKCGTKSFARDVFECAGVDFPPGESNCVTRNDAYEALARLWMRMPDMQEAVIKADLGVSGISNARIILSRMLPVNGTTRNHEKLTQHIRASLEHPETWRNVVEDVPHTSAQEFFTMYESCGGGVVERWMDGVIASPSVQLDVEPNGRVHILSTYDQILVGGMFKGGYSPAQFAYREQLIELAQAVGPELYRRGCMGNTSIDAVATCVDGHVRLYAIEVNARRGGTTHPIRMAAGVSGVYPDQTTGTLYTPDGRELFVEAHDNICHQNFVGVRAADVIALMAHRRMGFDGDGGMIAHLFGTLESYGKMGGTFMGRSPTEAKAHKEAFVQLLHDLSARSQKHTRAQQ